MTNTTKSGFTFVGLDLETSGIDHDIHAAIQVGVYLPGGGLFSELCAPKFRDLVWDENAAAIHKIPIEEILYRARRDSLVDRTMQGWLVTQGAKPRSLVPVGWNVGSFDMPFFRKQFPNTAELFSYRSVDLNSLAFTLAGKNFPESRTSTPPGYKGWKNRMKEEAAAKAEKLGYKENRHDAGYDALAGYLAWEYAREVIHG